MKALRQLTGREDEEQIWQQLRQGSVQAFDKMYDLYFFELYNYGRHFTTDLPLLEDSIQDLFCDLWTRHHQLSHVTYVKAYLFKALRRKLMRALKQQQRWLRDDHAGCDFEIVPSVEVKMMFAEQEYEKQKALYQALNALKPRQREMIFLKFFNNMSYEQVTEVMSESKSNVYKTVARALTILRTKLSDLALMLALAFSL
jgi:RNA polymerase sigma-70 factor (ECF subfamily)